VPTPVFDRERLQPLASELLACIESLARLGVRFRGSRTQRLANTVACTVEGVDSMTLLAGLDLEGICASSGSACSAGSLEPSHVMIALGASQSAANALVRFSLGRDTTGEDVRRVTGVFPKVVSRGTSAE